MEAEIKNQKSYKDFSEWAQRFRPKPEVNYEWCNAFSRWEYNRMAEIVSNLDKRAEDLIRLLTAGVGVLVLLVGYLLKSETSSQTLVVVAGAGVLPMLCFAVKALGSALKLKGAARLSVPPNAHDAITYAERHSEEEFWAEVAVASQGMRIAADLRGACLNDALKWLRWAIVWFVVIVAALCVAAFLDLLSQTDALSPLSSSLC